MNLSAPTNLIFFLSVIVAVIGGLSALGVIAFIPVASVWIMAIAYAILAIGCLFKGA